MKILLVTPPLEVKRRDQKARLGEYFYSIVLKIFVFNFSVHSTVTLLCNDEILELSSTPVSSQSSSHVVTGPGDDDDHEDDEEDGPQPWVAADNGGSDIPVAVGIFVATVVGTPVKCHFANIHRYTYFIKTFRYFYLL